MTRDVLIIGGTGVFGKRLVRHLAQMEGLTLHVASRNATRAAKFLDTVIAVGAMHPVALDRDVNLKERLATIKPTVVIDCSGPFQTCDYTTAKAVVEAGAHFIDLADARDYLAGFRRGLDEIARQNGVAALTGASSTPTLSTCAAQDLCAGWQRVDTVDICITPGGKSEVGRSVIEAIMSYVGKPVPIWRAGGLARVTGWGAGRAVEIPGLGPRRVAAVETYDAEYLGPHLKVASRVSFAAGLESRLEQWGIEGLAVLHQRGLIGAPFPLIPLLLKARRVTRIWTSDEGGMLVDVCGLDAQGRATQAKWSLVARKDHGPYIPILPAAAAVKKLLAGEVPAGADIAHSVIGLQDVVVQMKPYEITLKTSATRSEHSIFQQALGKDEFAALPSALQYFHKVEGAALWAGEADIDTGKGMLSRVLGRVFDFPKPGNCVQVSVTVDRNLSSNGITTEGWTRDFSGTQMFSELTMIGDHCLVEEFWPFRFTLAIRHDENELSMQVVRWHLGKLRLPKFLAPQTQATETMDQSGRFCFDVRLFAPIIGLIAHYRGWLRPVE